MMKRGFNQRKVEVLELLENRGEATASDVAQRLRITPVNASRLLGLYFREGLLNRCTINRFGEKRYDITERGHERLSWILRESPR